MYEKHFNVSFRNECNNDLKEEFLFCELNENYVNQTAVLLNSEWPRSVSQRVESLNSNLETNKNKNGSKLPVCLIIIRKRDDVVVGHANIVSITTMRNSVTTENLPFFQSVIIDNSLRGKGLGKKLMLLSEEYLNFIKKTENDVNFEWIYLTTKDKQLFYETLGYVKIDPIACYQAKQNSKCSETMKLLFSKMSITSQYEEIPKASEKEKELNDQKLSAKSDLESINKAPATGSIIPPPPPPPPPPAPQISLFKADTKDQDDIYKKSANIFWYKKKLQS